jgi:glycosyltransferase involved in cell wall biosynthesis
MLYNTAMYREIATCQIGQSASVNRNYGLEQVTSDIFVMMDDDITGFYPGWLTDLVQPMIDDPNIMVASIRCLDEKGNIGPMMGGGGMPVDSGVHDVRPSGYKDFKRVPTACIAVRKNPVRFDEGFKGSGYEDTAYLNRINEIYPGHRIVVNNNCKLIHLNNMVNQGGKYWEHNKKHYMSLFPDDTCVVNQSDWTVE